MDIELCRCPHIWMICKNIKLNSKNSICYAVVTNKTAAVVRATIDA